MGTSNRYTYLNGKYLQDARELLKKHDYPQASENLWGATAQIVKAIALKRGKKLRSHEAMNKYIVEIAKEAHDNSILVDFSVANSLHQNFYENWLAPETVIEDAKRIEKLIKRLKPLID